MDPLAASIAYDIAVYARLRDSDDLDDRAAIACHFYLSLFAAMDRADDVNFQKLAEAFPIHARLFGEFKRDSDAFLRTAF
jgi:hypothetical protein